MTNSPLIHTFDGILNHRPQPLCNARDLHVFLESKQDFSTWIKNRVRKYGFVEGQDYLLHKFVEQLPSGAKYLTDYHLSLNTAKELAMVENNEQGRRVRQYFIRIEEQTDTLQQAAVLDLQRRVQQLESMLTVRRYGSFHPDAILNDNQKQQILSSRKDWQPIYEMALKGMNSVEIGLNLNRDDSGVRYIVRRMRRCGILPPDARKVAMQIERELTVQHEHLLNSIVYKGE